MTKLLQGAFGIRPEETGLVTRFFAFYVGIGMFYTVGATVGDTLFLSSLGPREVPRILPWVYVGIAVANVGSALIFDAVQARVSRRTAILGTQVLLAVTVLLARFAVDADQQWVYVALVIWLEATALLSITLFFSFAGDYFAPRDARRLYGFIAGGMALGTVLSGYAINLSVEITGTKNLLYFGAAILLFNVAVSARIFNRSKPVRQREDENDDDDDEERVPLRAIFSRPYVRLLAMMIPLAIVTSVVVDYQMKWIASSKSEAELARFFGALYGWVGVAQILFQFLVVPRLLNRLGIITCLMILPLSVGIASVLLLGSAAVHFFGLGILMFSAGINVIRMTLSETLDLPSRELLYLPLPTRIRLRTQPLMTGALAPASQGIGGLLLLLAFTADIGVEALSLLVIATSFVLVFTLAQLRPKYRETLAAALRDHQLDATDLEQLIQSPNVEPLIEGLLASEDPELVRSTIALLDNRTLGTLGPVLGGLVSSPHSQVAIAALQRLAREKDPQFEGAIERAWESEEPEVRQAAVLALCEAAGTGALERVTDRLGALDPETRTSAIIGLAKHCGEQGDSMVRPGLQEQVHSAREEDRVDAAHLIGRIGTEGYAELLLPLLQDRSPAVKVAAIEACAQMGEPSLVPALLNSMQEPTLRAQVIRALASTPPEGVAPIVDVLKDDDRSVAIRRAMARVLARVGGYQSVNSVWEMTAPTQDLVLRLAAAEALRAIVEKVPSMELDLEGFDDRIDDVCSQIELLNAATREIGDTDDFAREIFGDHGDLHVELLLSLFACRYDARAMARIQHNLFNESTSEAINALELFEEVLPRKTAPRVIAALSEWVEEPQGSRGLGEDTRRALLQSEPWLKVTAIHHLNHGAAFPAIEAGALTEEDHKLYRHLDIVCFLKQVPVFAQLQAYYLLEQAEIAQWVSLPTGATLFRQGDPGDALYIICQGEVTVMQGQTELARLGAGQCIGEQALLDGEARSASAVMASDTALLRIAADRFTSLLVTQPVIAKAMLRTLEKRIRNTQAIGPAQEETAVPTRRSQFMRAQKLGLEQLVSTMSFLRQVDLFAELSRPAMANLAGIAQEVLVYEGDTVFAQGDVGESLYLICKGQVSILLNDAEVARLGRNACLGEMSLISGLPRSATAEAVGEGRLLRIGSDDFMSLLSTEPEIALALLKTLAQRLRAASTGRSKRITLGNATALIYQ